MREIKFRAKRTDDGAWVYGDLTHVQRINTKEEAEQSGRRSQPAVRVANYNVDEQTIGQYTGLKDKKGREIYEGDILRYRTYPVQVGWHEGAFCDCHMDMNILLRHHALNVYTIIGNIHDNPELLTE